ncbi:peptidase inhibitor family I36 protein [Streptomyces sp. NPDC058576]|uniref:peptidase inhibitor family I36 protein n=1 Tax=Streptomyces sp. NPDC058576 TaxID=3346547 RepID=UPI0036668899
MKSTNPLRSALVACVMALAAASTTQAAHAAPPRVMDECASNAICLWTGVNYTGVKYTWTSGYKDLPAAWRDHSYSFIANRDGGFIDWSGGQKLCRTVKSGHYATRYDQGFGTKIDAVDARC